MGGTFVYGRAPCRASGNVFVVGRPHRDRLKRGIVSTGWSKFGESVMRYFVQFVPCIMLSRSLLLASVFLLLASYKAAWFASATIAVGQSQGLQSEMGEKGGKREKKEGRGRRAKLLGVFGSFNYDVMSRWKPRIRISTRHKRTRLVGKNRRSRGRTNEGQS